MSLVRKPHALPPTAAPARDRARAGAGPRERGFLAGTPATPRPAIAAIIN
ncbi:hypothetical protein SAMN05878426_102435 [Phaeovulum vinaykumarii]|uniref:Uncharacterized protein n=1 Tax=Phaeovulum vinaykumarii TaxID=407234 RepID=A0A1N7KZ98_9RHOB|nr:hypothetical protein SAMN05421795_102337 [Phaeovulum vinaykumarii]SOC00935.1 hypothetical protein SAMN05878426_102435 [Phaeovulum vinaykumarii]